MPAERLDLRHRFLRLFRLAVAEVNQRRDRRGVGKGERLGIIAAEQPLVCPVCGVTFYAPGAEELAFNSQGACRRCGGTGTVRTVDRATLVPDESLTVDEGAVAPWNSLMWSLMTDVCRAMGVRTDVPFKDLTEEEKQIVYDGPMVKKHIFYRAKNSESVSAGEMDFTYYSATATVLTALPSLMQALSSYRMVIYSLLLIVVMIFKPSGLMGTRDISVSRFIERLLNGELFRSRKKEGKEHE